MITQQLRKVGNSYVVTVPKEEVERRGWQEGQLLAVQLTELEVRPVLGDDLREAIDERWDEMRRRCAISPVVEPWLRNCDIQAWPKSSPSMRRVMRGLGEAPRPLRDEGLLESALTRPQMAAYYEGADIVRQATLARDRHLAGAGLSRRQQAHRLPDARRLSLGQWLGVSSASRWNWPRQFEQFAERSERADEAIDAFEAWLREHVQPRGE